MSVVPQCTVAGGLISEELLLSFIVLVSTTCGVVIAAIGMWIAGRDRTGR